MKAKRVQKIILIILVILLVTTTILLFVPLGAFKKPRPSGKKIPFSSNNQAKFKPPQGKPKIKGPTSSPPGIEK
ncbi:hypothetical protein J7J41_01110 [bacterium]|nr:hypothetical protein [bacterium]